MFHTHAFLEHLIIVCVIYTTGKIALTLLSKEKGGGKGGRGKGRKEKNKIIKKRKKVQRKDKLPFM